MGTEYQLQKAVVKYLKDRYPNCYYQAILNEFGYKRGDRKDLGVTPGSSDLFIIYKE